MGAALPRFLPVNPSPPRPYFRATRALCAVECCDGNTVTLSASDPQDCYDQTTDADVCDGGPCGVRRLAYDDVDFFTRPCQSCCASCSKSRDFHVLAGVCEDCDEAARDYCALGGRGSLLTAAEAPWGTCPEQAPGSCSVECCDGTFLEFPSDSRNECYVEASGSAVCAGDDANTTPRTITFDGALLGAQGCDALVCRTVPPSQCGLIDPATNPAPSVGTAVACNSEADCNGGWACFSLGATCAQLQIDWPDCMANTLPGCGNYQLFAGLTSCCCPVTTHQECTFR